MFNNAKLASYAGGDAVMHWIGIDLDDVLIAIQAAESMAKKYEEDVAILWDLRTVLLKNAKNREILEVIIYEK